MYVRIKFNKIAGDNKFEIYLSKIRKKKQQQTHPSIVSTYPLT